MAAAAFVVDTAGVFIVRRDFALISEDAVVVFTNRAADLNAGVARVVLGTAAVKDPQLLKDAVTRFGEHIAVGVDIKNNYVAIKGWTEESSLTGMDFCRMLQDIGVSTVICTNISRDGAMKGANLQLYSSMNEALDLNIVASGGVSSEEDVRALREAGLYGAIIGKAYYTGAVDLKKILEEQC